MRWRRLVKNPNHIVINRRSFMSSLSSGILAVPLILNEESDGRLNINSGEFHSEREKSYVSIEIPEDQLDQTVQYLCDLVEMRFSNCFAEYEEEDLELGSLDRADAKAVRTLLDVIKFLVNQGQDTLVDHYYVLDIVRKFNEENLDEDLFREYLTETYGIDSSEFPPRS